ncbi:MAG: hypothetical protein U0P45_07760 [Acidimicrobiales bacterium]
MSTTQAPPTTDEVATSWRAMEPVLPPVEPGSERDPWGPIVAWLIAAAGPWGWAVRGVAPVPAIASMLVVTAVAVAASRRLRPTAPVTIGAALLAGAAATAAAGPITGAWLATTIVTSRVVAPPPDRPLWTTLPRQARIAAAVLAVIAGTNAALDHTPVAVALAAIATVVVPILLGRHGALAWVDRFAHAVGRILTSVLFSILAVFLVLIPHGLSRLFRTDLLATPGHWAHLPRRRGDATDAWADDRQQAPRVIEGRHIAWRKALRAAVIPLVLLVIAGVVWARRDDTSAAEVGFVLRARQADLSAGPEAPLRDPVPDGLEPHPPDPNATPTAQEGNPWFTTPAFHDAEQFALGLQGAWRNENPYRFLDFRSKYINMVDGIRKSWRAPACECRRVTVWMYGGSTTWGIGQRDDHTIASELARIAHEHGLTVDVQNRGITGFTQWQEAERFAYDLTVDPAPDLVLFYDGVNEIYHGNGDNHIRRSDEAPVDATLVSLWDGSLRSAPPLPPHPTGRVIEDDTPERNLTRRSKQIVARYDRARRSSAVSAGSVGALVRYVWQPMRYSRPLIPGEPNWNTSQENDMRLMTQETSNDLAKDVFDLSNVLDGNEDPIYTDDVHHNELGARLIAQGLYDHLEPDLQRLADSPKRGA